MNRKSRSSNSSKAGKKTRSTPKSVSETTKIALEKESRREVRLAGKKVRIVLPKGLKQASGKRVAVKQSRQPSETASPESRTVPAVVADLSPVSTMARAMNGNGKSHSVTASATKPAPKKKSPHSGPPKLFVLDTNVLLHDPTALHRFEENDLVIPITVLEEVEAFKKGSDTIHFHAREITRQLDELATSGSLIEEEGAPLGEGLGHVRVAFSGGVRKEVLEAFLHDNPDHRILSTALTVRDKNPNRHVVFVSKDGALRLKAHSLGLEAEDYENDKVPDLDRLYKGRTELEGVDNALIDRLYSAPFAIPLSDLGIDEPYPYMYFILRGIGKSALARYNARDRMIVRVEKRSAYGIMPRNSEQTFAMDALLDPDIQLVSLSGKAGTGKTLLALAGALEVRSKYEQIYLSRPVVPLGNRDIGYLPGDIQEKIGPYMQPLWDNLGVIRGQYNSNDPMATRLQEMIDREKLVITPLTYIRGRSFHRVFFIVDEAQNLTGHEVKTIITRAGEGAKIILTGDPQQIDSPYLDARSNGLTRLIDRMKGQDLYAHVTLEKGERSRLSDIASNLL